MSEVYKKHNDGLYFISFSVMGWIDVFTRRPYQEILINSIWSFKTSVFRARIQIYFKQFFFFIANTNQFKNNVAECRGKSSEYQPKAFKPLTNCILMRWSFMRVVTISFFRTCSLEFSIVG
jgi:hypothetical protein